MPTTQPGSNEPAFSAGPSGHRSSKARSRPSKGRLQLRTWIDSAREAEGVGEWDVAASRYQRALALAQSLRDERMTRWVSGHLGQVCLAWGESILRNVRTEDDCRAALELFLEAYERGFDGEYNRGNIELARDCIEPASSGVRLPRIEPSGPEAPVVASR